MCLRKTVFCFLFFFKDYFFLFLWQLPWQSSGWDFAFQCRRCQLDSWSGSWDLTCFMAKIKIINRSNIITNWIKTLKTGPHFKKNVLFWCWPFFKVFIELAPRPRIEPIPPALGGKFLTTGAPRKSPGK